MLKIICSVLLQEVIVWFIKETVFQYKLELNKKSDPGRN